ncbi:hypothetical protein [Mediterraneibacter gnavus]|uniref:hypothetical protein n=1 Tax=Mediterraneibacter gnavus TaxID=33038 RepID=UPI0035617266
MKEKRTGSRRGAAGTKLAGRVRFPPGAIRGKPNPKEYALRQKRGQRGSQLESFQTVNRFSGRRLLMRKRQRQCRKER